jgi:hypothetical protein
MRPMKPGNIQHSTFNAQHSSFGLRRQSRYKSGDAAFARAGAFDCSSTSGTCESAVAAALCQRSPKLLSHIFYKHLTHA